MRWVSPWARELPCQDNASIPVAERDVAEVEQNMVGTQHPLVCLRLAMADEFRIVGVDLLAVQVFWVIRLGRAEAQIALYIPEDIVVGGRIVGGRLGRLAYCSSPSRCECSTDCRARPSVAHRSSSSRGSEQRSKACTRLRLSPKKKACCSVRTVVVSVSPCTA